MQLANIGIMQSVSQSAPSARNLKLERSAHEFEASLMAELLKPLQETYSASGEDSEAGGMGSESALGDFASESLARAISERGGFGIADRVLRQLNSASSSAAPNSLSGKVT
jgi:Rod binding domain-containing protein